MEKRRLRGHESSGDWLAWLQRVVEVGLMERVGSEPWPEGVREESATPEHPGQRTQPARRR